MRKLIEEGSEDVLDTVRERGGGVGEFKGHCKGFKKTITGAESRFPFLSFSHVDQAVGVSDVEGSVIAGS